MTSDMLRRQEKCFSWEVAFLKLLLIIYCNVLQLHPDPDIAPRATDDQVKKAAALMKRIDLKDFSVCQFANPGMVTDQPCNLIGTRN